jgi:hypothetical protein
MRRLALAAVLAVALSLAAPAASLAADGLSATATPNRGKPGTVLRVDGANWTPGARLQIVTCGALGIGGSATCDLAATYTPIANPDGAFQAMVKLGKPPVPCPCVLHVSDASSTAAVDIPVVVVGQPKAPPPAPDLSPQPYPLTVASADLTGWGPWTAFFGAGPERTLVLTVRNNTAEPLESAPLRLYAGTKDDPGQELGQVSVGPIGPQSAAAFQLPVSLPGGIGGSYTVTGELEGAAPLTATTSSYAWGFYVLDVLLLVVLILLVITMLRRRRDPPAASGRHSPAAGESEVEAPVGEDTQDLLPFPSRE